MGGSFSIKSNFLHSSSNMLNQLKTDTDKIGDQESVGGSKPTFFKAPKIKHNPISIAKRDEDKILSRKQLVDNMLHVATKAANGDQKLENTMKGIVLHRLVLNNTDLSNKILGEQVKETVNELMQAFANASKNDVENTKEDSKQVQTVDKSVSLTGGNLSATQALANTGKNIGNMNLQELLEYAGFGDKFQDFVNAGFENVKTLCTMKSSDLAYAAPDLSMNLEELKKLQSVIDERNNFLKNEDKELFFEGFAEFDSTMADFVKNNKEAEDFSHVLKDYRILDLGDLAGLSVDDIENVAAKRAEYYDMDRFEENVEKYKKRLTEIVEKAKVATSND